MAARISRASRGPRHSYSLRARGPKRTDAELCVIMDGIRDYDCLRYIYLLATLMPSHSYGLRPRASLRQRTRTRTDP